MGNLSTRLPIFGLRKPETKRSFLKMRSRLAKENDAEGWMRLVDNAKESFPGLETAEALQAHKHTALEASITQVPAVQSPFISHLYTRGLVRQIYIRFA